MERNKNFTGFARTSFTDFVLVALVVLSCQFACAGDDWFAGWYNSDKWYEAGSAILNPDQSRLLLGTPGKGVLINGRIGKCPSLVTKRGDYQDVEIHVEFMVARGSTRV